MSCSSEVLGRQPWRSKSFFKWLTSAHTVVSFLLSLPQTQPQEAVFGEVCLCYGKFTRLGKAAFPPAWKTPHICVPAWAWSFIRLSLMLSPWLRNSEKAGLVLVVLCHSGIPGLTFSGEIEAGSCIGWLLPQIFQHIHNKSLVWSTSSLCSSCQSTLWDPGSTSSRLAGHLPPPAVP